MGKNDSLFGSKNFLSYLAIGLCIFYFGIESGSKNNPHKQQIDSIYQAKEDSIKSDYKFKIDSLKGDYKTSLDSLKQEQKTQLKSLDSKVQ